MTWQKKVELATRHGMATFVTVHVAEDHTVWLSVTFDEEVVEPLLRGTMNQWGDLVHALEEALRKSEGEA